MSSKKERVPKANCVRQDSNHTYLGSNRTYPYSYVSDGEFPTGTKFPDFVQKLSKGPGIHAGGAVTIDREIFSYGVLGNLGDVRTKGTFSFWHTIDMHS